MLYYPCGSNSPTRFSFVFLVILRGGLLSTALPPWMILVSAVCSAPVHLKNMGVLVGGAC